VLAVLWLGSEVVTAYHGRLFLPSDTRSLLRNLLILFEHGTQPRLVPPAWALTVELFFYACMGLGFSRTRGVTLVWFAASAVYTVYVNLADLPWAFQYYLVPAASLPFATGALIYHYEEPLRATFGFLRHHRVPLALFALVLLNFAATRAFGTGSQQGFYANYALHALLVASLAGRQSLPGISRRLDDRLGDFSYPIYLVHLQAGLLLVGLGIGLHRRELPFALVSLPVIFLLSWLLTAVVERPIETLRQRIKGSR
jgi:peptidoglycan/LPS O-acetylase OafA/YrhL